MSRSIIFKAINYIQGICIPVVIVMCTVEVCAQDLPPALTDQIEAFLEEENDDVDILYLLELLRSYQKNPLDLNSASYDELKELRLLNDIQINALIDHMTRTGDLIAIEELQSIRGFELDDIRRIMPFVKLSNEGRFQRSLPDMLLESEHELFFKLSRIMEEKRGFIKDFNGKSAYAGDPNKIFMRYRNAFENRLRIGLTLEKDAGESMMPISDQLGFDYLSGHFHLRDYTKTLEDLIIGDYNVSMGQGLISHNDFAAGKSALVNSMVRGGRFVRPYNSVNENNLYRGVAASFKLHDNISTGVFVSRSRRDANIALDSLDEDREQQFISSLQLSGNHRTESEIEDRQAVGLSAYGAQLKYSSRKYHVGLNLMSHHFDNNLDRGDAPYNRFRFQGQRLINSSLDYNLRFGNFNFFGESAISDNGGLAYITGVLLALEKYTSLSVVYRNYSRDYTAVFPNAFGESASINNERGLYIGFETRLMRGLSLRAYSDIWQHPWVKFGVSRPSYGREHLLRLDYYLKRKLLFYVQYLYENKDADYILSSDRLQSTGSQVRKRLRLNLNHNANLELELRTRLEFSFFENPEGRSKGILVYQDFLYRSINSPLSFTARFALFDTDNFDSRIFAYENTVLYEFSIPAYFGQGFRYYFNARIRTTRSMTLEMRIARTHLTREESFSSGNEMIDGDTKTELKIQLRYQF